jgi:hypothetical protein
MVKGKMIYGKRVKGKMVYGKRVCVLLCAKGCKY